MVTARPVYVRDGDMIAKLHQEKEEAELARVTAESRARELEQALRDGSMRARCKRMASEVEGAFRSLSQFMSRGRSVDSNNMTESYSIPIHERSGEGHKIVKASSPISTRHFAMSGFQK